MSTDSAHTSPPKWLQQPPTAFDIVTAYYPETKPKGDLRLRPCLSVLQGKTSGGFALQVAYGTKHLKFQQRKSVDLIIQNHTHLQEHGLAMATRFNLDTDNIVVLPWTEEFFGCWTGRHHPRIGHLSENYIRDLAFSLMMRKMAEDQAN